MAQETPSQKFENALEELDVILRDLEDGTTTLDESLVRYERGIALVKQCHSQLDGFTKRIKELIAVDGDGKPNLRDFEHTPTDASGKSTHRRESRS